jgi:hypothetical protein
MDDQKNVRRLRPVGVKMNGSVTRRRAARAVRKWDCPATTVVSRRAILRMGDSKNVRRPRPIVAEMDGVRRLAGGGEGGVEAVFEVDPKSRPRSGKNKLWF